MTDTNTSSCSTSLGQQKYFFQLNDYSGQITKMATFTCRKSWNLKSSQLYLKSLNSLLNYLKCRDKFFAEPKIRNFWEFELSRTWLMSFSRNLSPLLPTHQEHFRPTTDISLEHVLCLFKTHNWLYIFQCKNLKTAWLAPHSHKNLRWKWELCGNTAKTESRTLDAALDLRTEIACCDGIHACV